MAGNGFPPPSASTVGGSVTVLKQAASRLSPIDLDELFKHITILRRLSGANKNKPPASLGAQPQVASTESTWQERILYDALAGHMAKQLGSRTAMPLSAFRKTPVYSQWCQAIAQALEYHQHWLPNAQRPETVSMLRLYADMVISHLNNPDHPHGFGWKNICWGLENLAMIEDKNFPDYLSNGLLTLVAKLRTAPPPNDNEKQQTHER